MQAIADAVKSGELRRFDRPLRALLPFADETSKIESGCLPITANDYRELVSITAAAKDNRKRNDTLTATATLTRLGLTESQWITTSLAFRHHYRSGDLILKEIA
jgi:hypothetical protein